MQSHLMDKSEVCRYFGGSKPINPSTLYRNIRKGIYPRPLRVGGLSRWLKSECEQVLQAMVEGRS